jgi:neutral ceramidase
MRFHFRGAAIALLIIAVYTLPAARQVDAANIAQDFKAGLAKVSITPEKPMAGYASRDKPSQGKVHELYAKALAVIDARGNRAVLVTTDVLGLPRALTSEISEHANKSYGLKREQILFNSSHTHSGPVLAGSLAGAYELDATQSAAVNDYTQQLKHKLIKLIGAALKDATPAQLSFGRGTAQFAMNRREMTERGMRIGVNREGPVDREVPVLKVAGNDNKLRGVVFGYACHNTTLTGEFYELSGDYSGFAQEAIEHQHPGVTAMFVAGCGADINPYPRSQLELAKQHGAELAQSVAQVLTGQMAPLRGGLKSIIGGVGLPFAQLPTKAEWQARLQDTNAHRRSHAQRMLSRLERDGKLMTEYPYTIQILQIGDLKLIGLAGEVVTDYSLRLKRELGGNTWVAGYSNDLCSYIPSARMFKEGGYEVIDSMIYYDLPGSYVPAIEDKIIAEVHQLARRLDGKQTNRK